MNCLLNYNLTYLLRRMAWAVTKANDKLIEVHNIPDHHIGAELIQVFVEDLIGQDSILTQWILLIGLHFERMLMNYSM